MTLLVYSRVISFLRVSTSSQSKKIAFKATNRMRIIRQSSFPFGYPLWAGRAYNPFPRPYVRGVELSMILSQTS